MFSYTSLEGARIPEPLPAIAVAVSPNSTNEGEKLFIQAREKAKAKVYKEAFAYYFQAALLNHVPSMFYMGKCWESGKGSEISNVAEAMQWYKAASDRGHKESSYRVSILSVKLLQGKEETPTIKYMKEAGQFPIKITDQAADQLEQHFAQGREAEKQIRKNYRAQGLYA